MARPSYPPEPKQKRPETRGEAIRLIGETFAFNDWHEREEEVFLADIGLGKNWKEFEVGDLRKIVREFEKLRMVLF